MSTYEPETTIKLDPTLKPDIFEPKQDEDNHTQYAISSVICVSIFILVGVVLVKFCYLRRLSAKNFQNARRIRTVSETLRDRPPQYNDIPCRVATSPDGSIEIAVPESPPYVKDPPPYIE
ncbi:uncharacterized protein [Mytilus edulis]|uniref:uncharacterized protein n=1 Tax=Mytilus edulis TaxID=6550 RepID=UPI0039EF4F31